MILTIHIVLLAVFVLVTTLLVVMAVINRLRVRDVCITWSGHGSIKDMQWPGLLLFSVIGLVVYTGLSSNPQYLYLALGYITGGLCWFSAIRISSTTLITDFAVIRNTSRKGNVLGWNQITDFFVRESASSVCYVFFYREMDGTQARFELTVPRSSHDVFKKMVCRRVEKKALPVHQRAYG